jgi:hypothetical protein
MMKQLIHTLKIYYTIIFRVKPVEATPLDIWLRAKGWNYNQDFYAALLLIPFALMVVTGVVSEKLPYNATFGINLIAVLCGYIGLNLAIDILGKHHLLASNFYKQIKILPLSTFEKLFLLFFVEFFGYKFYACCMTIVMVASFNHFYAAHLPMPIHPKTTIVCFAILILSCNLGLINNTLTNFPGSLPKSAWFWGSRAMIFMLIMIAYKLKLHSSIDLLYEQFCFMLDNHFFVFLAILALTNLFLLLLASFALRRR